MRLKKTSIGPLRRLRAGLGAGVTVATVVFSFLAGGLSLLLGPSPYVFASAIVPVITIGLIIAWIKGRATIIPPLFLDELSDEQNYKCQPCSPGNLRAAVEMVRPLFGRANIEIEVLEQWRLRNPSGFMEIVDAKDDLIACFVVVGLAKSFFDEFIAGRFTENDISGEDVLDMRETKRQPIVYISGVMVRDPGGVAGGVRTRYLIWAMLMYLKHHFRLQDGRRLYALALTSESERLLKKLDFSIASHAINRRDRHNFYSLSVDLTTWKKLLCRVGDLKVGCQMHYQRKR